MNRLCEAAEYLESQRTGTGELFVAEVERALCTVADYPRAYPAVPGEPNDTRRVVLPRFGYWIVYEKRKETVVVLTVWHAVQEPDSWRE